MHPGVGGWTEGGATCTSGEVRLLLYMPEMSGMDPGVLWEDLKLAKHIGDLERYAAVSASNLTQWSTKLGGALLGGRARWFDTSRYGEAWRWVRQ